MKYILKAITSLENRGILLKATNKKVLNQKGGFLDNVLGPLMKAILWLMKNVLRSLAKIVLMPSGLKAAASATDTAIQYLMD